MDEYDNEVLAYADTWERKFVEGYKPVVFWSWTFDPKLQCNDKFNKKGSTTSKWRDLKEQLVKICAKSIQLAMHDCGIDHLWVTGGFGKSKEMPLDTLAIALRKKKYTAEEMQKMADDHCGKEKRPAACMHMIGVMNEKDIKSADIDHFLKALRKRWKRGTSQHGVTWKEDGAATAYTISHHKMVFEDHCLCESDSFGCGRGSCPHGGHSNRGGDG